MVDLLDFLTLKAIPSSYGSQRRAASQSPDSTLASRRPAAKQPACVPSPRINSTLGNHMSNDAPQDYNIVKTAAGYFALILLGSLIVAALGGGFAFFIAKVSPQFVKGLFSLKPEEGSVARYAFSVGMIWGLFIGVAVSCFTCLLTTILKIVRLRIEQRGASRNA